MGRSAIVAGAGIAGLAMARALAVRGYKVRVFERNGKATGASIRNFGMIWPVGQPDGELRETAMKSRSIWGEVCGDAKIWHEPNGSLHVAHAGDEWDVLQELAGIYQDRDFRLLDAKAVSGMTPNVVTSGLKGGLFSPWEMIVDPRVVIDRLPVYLTEKYGVDFHFNEPVLKVQHPFVETHTIRYEADEIYICSGADFESLYPEVFRAQQITRCKLQMMRMEPQPQRIGPALCGGLSLGHYQSFRAAKSLGKLQERFIEQYPELLKWGIHVMVSQQESGELTIGDSHEYGDDPVPFDNTRINDLILEYLAGFAQFKNNRITQTWNGVYPKLTDGRAMLIERPADGVTIVNGFGGAGMTLAFGACERLLEKG